MRALQAAGEEISGASARSTGLAWLGATVGRYGGWLGDVMTAASVAAQRFHAETETPPGARLLFTAMSAPRISTADAPRLDLLLPVSSAGAKELSDRIYGSLEQAASDAGIPSIMLAQLLENLIGAMSRPDSDVAGISKSLAELGQALGHKHADGISKSYTRLSAALGAECASAASPLQPREQLERVLGAMGIPAVCNPDVLRHLTAALGAGAAHIAVTEELLNQLKQAFSGNGFQLSDSVSIAPGCGDWLIRDQSTGQAFHAVPAGEQLEIRGREEGRLYRVHGVQLRLPTKVRDASRGVAIYSVPVDVVQNLLDLHPQRVLRAWDTGSRQTPVAIFVVDYRDSDLGSYGELGIACFAAPGNDRLAVGMYTLELPVTQSFSRDAGREIWGYPKELYRVDIGYRDHEVTCVLAKQDGSGEKLLTLTLPRGGTDSSRDVPLYSYTIKRGQHYRTVFTHSGRGEMVTWGGRGVRLQIHARQADSVLNTLEWLGLPGRTSVLSSWTEHMSGEFSVPSALPVQGSRSL